MGAQFSTAQRRAEANRRDADRQAQVDAMADGIPDELINSQVNGVLSAVTDRLSAAENYADFTAGCADAVPIATGGIQDTAEKVNLMGEVFGRAPEALPPNKGAPRG
jgi:hypothetical protein